MDLTTPPSDGRCTGFPDGLFGWDWTACCVVHDAGGSDGQLLDCIAGTVPGWAAFLVAAGIAAMILFRPVYNLLQRAGWVR